MGRRKIEIEPITNERNRSVTFLKRKNGLFKKAYELGVLCSVDIAVIVFEERPGHPVKMHQYCSNNVNNVLQRFMRFEGTRDCKGPHDYNDKLGNDDGDEEDDEDDGPAPSDSKTNPKAPGRQLSFNMAKPSSSSNSHNTRPSTSAPEHSAKRPRLAADLDPTPNFADSSSSSMSSGPPISAAAYRYLGSSGSPALGHHHAHGLSSVFPPPHSLPHGLGSTHPLLAGLPPAASHPSLFPLYGHGPHAQALSGPSHEYGALPSIRSSAVASAAASYASALARGDIHAAQAASAAMYAHGGLGTPPAPPPKYGGSDLFDFEWPDHRPLLPPSRAEAAGFPLRPSQASPGHGVKTEAPDPRTDPSDLSWLNFLSQGGGSEAGGPPQPETESRTVAENDGAVNDWLDSMTGPPAAGQREQGSRSGSSQSATSFLPSPVHSEGEGED